MDKHYLAMAREIATHSHCTRRKVAAILITEDGSHTVTAVNNPFPDITACESQGCLRERELIQSGSQLDVCRCLHSETSLICQCAQKGISTRNATVYTTLYPCVNCAKILIAAGVRRIIYSEPYSDKRATQLFAAAQIQVDQI